MPYETKVNAPGGSKAYACSILSSASESWRASSRLGADLSRAGAKSVYTGGNATITPSTVWAGAMKLDRSNCTSGRLEAPGNRWRIAFRSTARRIGVAARCRIVSSPANAAASPPPDTRSFRRETASAPRGCVPAAGSGQAGPSYSGSPGSS